MRLSDSKPFSSIISEFDDVMNGSMNIKIDPDRCLPLTRVSALVESVVSSHVKLFCAPFESENTVIIPSVVFSEVTCPLL